MAGEILVPGQSGGVALLRAILSVRLFDSTRRGRSHALPIITSIKKFPRGNMIFSKGMDAMQCLILLERLNNTPDQTSHRHHS